MTAINGSEKETARLRNVLSLYATPFQLVDDHVMAVTSGQTDSGRSCPPAAVSYRTPRVNVHRFARDERQCSREQRDGHFTADVVRYVMSATPKYSE